MVVIHCRGHKKTDSHAIQGNVLADKAAKVAAAGQVLEIALLPELFGH